MFVDLNLSPLVQYELLLSATDGQTASYGVKSGGDTKSPRFGFIFPDATPLQERKVGTANFNSFRRADACLSKIPSDRQNAEIQLRAIVDQYDQLTSAEQQGLQEESKALYSAAYYGLAGLPQSPKETPLEYSTRQATYLTRARDISDVDGQPSYMLSKIMLVYGSKCKNENLKTGALDTAAYHAKNSLHANKDNPGALVLSEYIRLLQNGCSLGEIDIELETHITLLSGHYTSSKQHDLVPRQMRYCQLMLIDQGLLPSGDGSVFAEGSEGRIHDAIKDLPDGDYRKGKGYVLLANCNFGRKLWVAAKGFLLSAVKFRSGGKRKAYELLYRLHLKATVGTPKDEGCAVADELGIGRKTKQEQGQYFVVRGVDIEQANQAEGFPVIIINRCKQLAKGKDFHGFRHEYGDLCQFTVGMPLTVSQQQEIANLEALSNRLLLQIKYDMLLLKLKDAMQNPASDVEGVMETFEQLMVKFEALEPGSFTVIGQVQDVEMGQLWEGCAEVVSMGLTSLLNLKVSLKDPRMTFIKKFLHRAEIKDNVAAGDARGKLEAAERVGNLAEIDKHKLTIQQYLDSGDVRNLLKVPGFIEEVYRRQRAVNPPDGKAGHLSPAELLSQHRLAMNAYKQAMVANVHRLIEADSDPDDIDILLEDHKVASLLGAEKSSLMKATQTLRWVWIQWNDFVVALRLTDSHIGLPQAREIINKVASVAATVAAPVATVINSKIPELWGLYRERLVEAAEGILDRNGFIGESNPLLAELKDPVVNSDGTDSHVVPVLNRHLNSKEREDKQLARGKSTNLGGASGYQNKDTTTSIPTGPVKNKEKLSTPQRVTSKNPNASDLLSTKKPDPEAVECEIKKLLENKQLGHVENKIQELKTAFGDEDGIYVKPSQKMLTEKEDQWKIENDCEAVEEFLSQKKLLKAQQCIAKLGLRYGKHYSRVQKYEKRLLKAQTQRGEKIAEIEELLATENMAEAREGFEALKFEGWDGEMITQLGQRIASLEQKVSASKTFTRGMYSLTEFGAAVDKERIEHFLAKSYTTFKLADLEGNNIDSIDTKRRQEIIESMEVVVAAVASAYGTEYSTLSSKEQVFAISNKEEKLNAVYYDSYSITRSKRPEIDYYVKYKNDIFFVSKVEYDTFTERESSRKIFFLVSGGSQSDQKITFEALLQDAQIVSETDITGDLQISRENRTALLAKKAEVLDVLKNEGNRRGEIFNQQQQDARQEEVYLSTTKEDFYAILGVHFQAKDGQITSAYHKKASCMHPDRGKTVGEEGMKELSKAYKILKNSSKRACYDVNYKKNILPRKNKSNDTDT